MQSCSIARVMLGMMVIPSLLFGGIVRFDLSSALEAEVGGYDIVGTANEIAQGAPYSVLGDHNVLSAGYGTRRSYVSQGSLAEGIGLPDDGRLGIYQLGPYDNPEEDYLVKRNNSIILRTNDDGESNIVVRDVDLPPHQQVRCNAINLAFVNHATSHSSTSYRTWIEVTYTDDTSEIVLDTGIHSLTSAINEGRIAGMLGGAGLTVNGEPQGGFGNLTDITSFENQAPDYPATVFRPKLLLAMDRHVGNASIVTDDTAIWELDSMIPVNPKKFLKRITINLRGPSSNANRYNRLFVLAISGDTVDVNTLIIVK